MENKKENVSARFIDYLVDLSKGNERGALAVLRRGLSSPPGEDVGMYRYVARFVPESERGKEREKVYYLVAALFAYHQIATDAERFDFGASMAQAAAQMGDIASTERRFSLLLATHQADMADYLRQAVSFVKSKEVAINWKLLMRDLLEWDQPDKYVQRRWANSFWAYEKPEESTSSQA